MNPLIVSLTPFPSHRLSLPFSVSKQSGRQSKILITKSLCSLSFYSCWQLDNEKLSQCALYTQRHTHIDMDRRSLSKTCKRMHEGPRRKWPQLLVIHLFIPQVKLHSCETVIQSISWSMTILFGEHRANVKFVPCTYTRHLEIWIHAPQRKVLVGTFSSCYNKQSKLLLNCAIVHGTSHVY